MFTKWFHERKTREFGSIGEYTETDAPKIPLSQLLNIDINNLKSSTKDILDVEQQPESFKISFTELTKGVHALLQFQDILEVSLDPKDGEIVNRHYAYYESLVYLRESIASWLDGNVLSALILLRPFQEIAILHLYWHLHCRDNSYESYYSWLRDNRRKPSFFKTLNYICDNMPSKGYISNKRLIELKRITGNIYKSLSDYHHATNMNDSSVAQSGGLGNLGLRYFLFYLEMVLSQLRQIIYLFVLTYPISLFPVDKYKKWAFSMGPVGLFFDKTNCYFRELFRSR